MERARKKQLVWNPDKGFVSRDELEKERQREAERTMPKNEAERILEVLESMGKGSEAQAKRNSGRVSLLPSDVVSRLTTLCAAEHQRTCFLALYIPVTIDCVRHAEFAVFS